MLDIEFSDLPKWAQDAAQSHIGGKARPHTWLCVGEVASVGHVPDDYSRQVVMAYRNGETKTASSGYYESLINAGKTERAMYFGGDVPLPVDGAILRIVIGPHNFIWFYVHPQGPWASIGRRLTSPEQTDLNIVQATVLGMVVGLTSAGRKDALARYRIPVKLYETVLEELAGKGLVKINKAGAVQATILGRQIRGTSYGSSWWYEWRRDKAKVEEVLDLYPQFKRPA